LRTGWAHWQKRRRKYKLEKEGGLSPRHERLGFRARAIIWNRDQLPVYVRFQMMVTIPDDERELGAPAWATIPNGERELEAPAGPRPGGSRPIPRALAARTRTGSLSVTTAVVGGCAS
jgi:hypothetical protein